MSTEPASIFWFRRDLRLEDNHGLFRALSAGGRVRTIFIFDQDILGKLEDRDDRRVSFIHDRVSDLAQRIAEHGGRLLVKYGRPEAVFQELLAANKYGSLHFNHDHEPEALERDAAVERLFRAKGCDVHSYKDQTVFERSEVVKDDGTPYTVFTPFGRKWRAALEANGLVQFPSERHLDKLEPWSSAPAMPTLKDMGFVRSAYEVAPFPPPTEQLRNYAELRNLPAKDGSTGMGVHLRFGTVSPRELVRLAMKHSDVWLNELIWREFFMQILWHFPHVVKGAFRPAYDRIKWRNDEAMFQRWCEGRTGYPLVDAGMLQLRATGHMHNRVRMLVASFLVKDLLIDWRWGEAWFARWLMDFELSSNNGNWQWAAGTGCDAAPYFRVFHPTTQLKRFDPDLEYVKRWAPDHAAGKGPAPIVDHDQARKRAIAAFKDALA
ncbi:MAG: deoxyribodipyrimidine photo-lyase [Flavobacteriales bacterium]|nr:deoxyribodipyrimidine photo-lyase [Flavobacteriales bacterium]